MSLFYLNFFNFQSDISYAIPILANMMLGIGTCYAFGLICCLSLILDLLCLVPLLLLFHDSLMDLFYIFLLSALSQVILFLLRIGGL